MDEQDIAVLAERDAVAYDSAADELEAAIRHLRLAAQHCRDRDVPRDAAHGFAAYGHVLQARAFIADSAKFHSDKARA
jgi:hypothetical protein